MSQIDVPIRVIDGPFSGLYEVRLLGGDLMTTAAPHDASRRDGLFAFEKGSPPIPGLLIALCLAAVRRRRGLTRRVVQPTPGE